MKVMTIALASALALTGTLASAQTSSSSGTSAASPIAAPTTGSSMNGVNSKRDSTKYDGQLTAC
jgi:hypothetical protein